MFTPVSLYQLQRDDATDFITKITQNFDWFIFLFYGECLENTPISIEDIPFLAELSGKKIAVVDFLPPSNHTRGYLYNSWRQHLPPEVNPSLASLFQRSYELATTSQEREVLERLFYTKLFQGDSFQPSLAIVNIAHNYMIRRKFTYPHDKELQDSLFKFVELIEENSLLKNYSPELLGELFNPKENSLYKPRSAQKQDLQKAFVDFLDCADDALLALNSQSNLVEIQSLKIHTTEKFSKAFTKLDQEIQKEAIRAIEKLMDQRQYRRGLGLEKINLSKHITIYRMRITNKYRIHFQGSPDKPIFINIGSHKLSDYGYTMD